MAPPRTATRVRTLVTRVISTVVPAASLYVHMSVLVTVVTSAMELAVPVKVQETAVMPDGTEVHVRPSYLSPARRRRSSARRRSPSSSPPLSSRRARTRPGP